MASESAILSLPFDVSQCLFSHTTIQDVLSLRQTCRTFHSITQYRCVWQTLLTGLMQQNLPIPGLANQPIDLLSACELEHLARKSLRLHRNWTSLSPVASNKLTVECDAFPSQHVGVRTFEFLPGRGGRYLLSLSRRSAPHMSFSLQCWDLKTSKPRCVAERISSRCSSLAVNREQASQITLAIQTNDLEFLGVDLSATDPASGFLSIIKTPEHTDRLVALQGSLFVTQGERLPQQHHLYLWDVSNPGTHIELRSDDNTLEKTFDVLIQGDVVVVFRLTRLEIYALRCPEPQNIVEYPIARHTWQWSLDSFSSAARSSWPLTPKKHPAINILLRFGSQFPWPVNIIHHFVLRPNSTYDESKPVNAENVPYDVVPILRRQIGSPVRLFSNYHMAVGSRGTAVWIDNHAEDHFKRGDCGQRLAGSLQGAGTSALRADDDAGEGLGIDSSMELGLAKQSSVFGYCENDQWTRVAVDEEEGRIAVGYLDGTIVVHDYA